MSPLYLGWNSPPTRMKWYHSPLRYVFLPLLPNWETIPWTYTHKFVAMLTLNAVKLIDQNTYFKTHTPQSFSIFTKQVNLYHSWLLQHGSSLSKKSVLAGVIHSFSPWTLLMYFCCLWLWLLWIFHIDGSLQLSILVEVWVASGLGSSSSSAPGGSVKAGGQFQGSPGLFLDFWWPLTSIEWYTISLKLIFFKFC